MDYHRILKAMGLDKLSSRRGHGLGGMANWALPGGCTIPQPLDRMFAYGLSIQMEVSRACPESILGPEHTFNRIAS